MNVPVNPRDAMATNFMDLDDLLGGLNENKDFFAQQDAQIQKERQEAMAKQ